jgi:hypothetical protein
LQHFDQTAVTAANTLDIMASLEDKTHDGNTKKLCNTGMDSYLGSIRDRIIPALMPRGDDDEVFAFYLQYEHTELDMDQRVIQVVARITWKQDAAGTMMGRKLNVYDSPLLLEISVYQTGHRFLNCSIAGVR